MKTKTFLALAISLFITGCIQETAAPHVDQSHESTANITDPLCDSGERYVCQCPDGGLGNKFCSWMGDSFSECILCGEGAEYLENTGIPCDTNPPAGTTETPCAPMDGCVGLVCYSKTCWKTTKLPGVRLDDPSNNCVSIECDENGAAVMVPDPSDCDGTCDTTGTCLF